MFALEREFGADATVPELTDTLLRLLALYDGAYGYCLPKKDKERCWDFVSLMRQNVKP